ncbi:MAG: DinB family protein [Fimbriimonadaceae bacterium]|nr:DinB family protein [Fimbriimonadaceae bacterium]
MSEIHSSKIDLPTHDGRFTPREVVAHLADWEPILRARMQQTKDQPGSTIVPYDEGQRALDMDYAQKDWRVEIDRYIALRAETKKWLETLTAEDWNLTAVHAERGPQSLADQANLLLGHDLYHIEQLADVIEREIVGTW